jgi:hypothetical protein
MAERKKDWSRALLIADPLYRRYGGAVPLVGGAGDQPGPLQAEICRATALSGAPCPLLQDPGTVGIIAHRRLGTVRAFVGKNSPNKKQYRTSLR